MKIENIIKGPVMTITGLCFMITAGICWFIGYLTDWQAGIAGIIGFMLLFMRDDIPKYIKAFLTIVISKFSNKNK